MIRMRNFFIRPALVGDRKHMLLGNRIVNQVGQGNWGFAAVMAIVLLASTVALLGIVRLVASRFLWSPREEQA